MGALLDQLVSQQWGEGGSWTSWSEGAETGWGGARGGEEAVLATSWSIEGRSAGPVGAGKKAPTEGRNEYWEPGMVGPGVGRRVPNKFPISQVAQPPGTRPRSVISTSCSPPQPVGRETPALKRPAGLALGATGRLRGAPGHPGGRGSTDGRGRRRRGRTARHGRSMPSDDDTKSCSTHDVGFGPHVKFVWRPAFYASPPYKKVPVGSTNSDTNIFPRKLTQSEVGEYVRRAKVGKLEEGGLNGHPPSRGC